MILAFIGLWSICAIYITYLLLKRNMKVAAVAYTALYAIILLWAFSVFVVDAMNFGISEVVNSQHIIYGGDMYDSFAYLSEAIYGLPSAFGTAVLYAFITLAASVIAVLFISGYRAVKQICHLLKRSYSYVKRISFTVREKAKESSRVSVDILKLCCRANC